MAWDASVKIKKSTNGGVTKAEIGNLFENLKFDLLNTVSSQLMTTQVKKTQDESDKALAMFCPKCKEKHSLKECKVNNINLCNLYDMEHSTICCSELPRLKEALKESGEEAHSSYFIGSRKSWKPQSPGMSQYFSLNMWNNVCNTQQFPWQYPTPPPT